MKNRVLSILAAVALVFLLTFPVAAPAAPPTGSSPPKAAPAPPAERHPAIRVALGALRRAKAHLEQAAHDFGGHRVEAIKATDEAIRQLEICQKYDKD
jgi:hypothetical protein